MLSKHHSESASCKGRSLETKAQMNSHIMPPLDLFTHWLHSHKQKSLIEPNFNHTCKMSNYMLKNNLCNIQGLKDIYYFVEGTRSLSSQISSKETKNVKQAGLSLQRKKHSACFLPRRLGMDVVNSLGPLSYLYDQDHTWIPQTHINRIRSG